MILLKMKAKLIINILKYAIPVALIAGLAIVIAMLVKSNRELGRMRNDFDVEITGRKDIQQTITPKELKRYFSDEIAKLKEYGVLAKNIENIVNVSYVYRDTMLYRDTLVYVYDTVRNVVEAPFNIETGCWNVSGVVTDKSITVDGFEMRDSILISLYKEKRKCLFERRKVKAVAISSCKGDTLTILRNLKIER